MKGVYTQDPARLWRTGLVLNRPPAEARISAILWGGYSPGTILERNHLPPSPRVNSKVWVS